MDVIGNLHKSVREEKNKVYQQRENLYNLSNLCNHLAREFNSLQETIASKDEVIYYHKMTIANLQKTTESLVKTINQTEYKKRLRAINRKMSRNHKSFGESLINLKPLMERFDERMENAASNICCRSAVIQDEH